MSKREWKVAQDGREFEYAVRASSPEKAIKKLIKQGDISLEESRHFTVSTRVSFDLKFSKPCRPK